MRLLPTTFLAACSLGCSVEPAQAPRVVLISIDTLRADHLPSYGYARDTAPELARLAAEDGVVFERCFAQAPWTLPSHMSMLTGLYPVAHGVLNAERRLSRNVVTLAERLRDAGLATAAFTDGGYVSPGYGLEDGFERYEDERLPGPEGEGGLGRILPHAEAWLRRHRDQGFFLFLHTYEVHSPYPDDEPWFSMFDDGEPPSEAHAQALVYLRGLVESHVYGLERYQGLDQLVATYDGLIRRMDGRLGRLFALLRELGLYDDTLIVVTSDHGESFLDRGIYAGHGLMLDDAELHVPLIVKYPGNRFAGTRHGALVESIDIAPTILTELGLPFEARQAQGHDLTALLEGGPDPSDHAFSMGGGLYGRSVRGPQWTLIDVASKETATQVVRERLSPDDPERVLDRLRIEPLLFNAAKLDKANQRAAHPDVEERLRATLSSWEFMQYREIHDLDQAAEAREQLDERELERLKALGYL